MSLTASVLRLDRAAVRGLRITDLYSLHRVVYSLYEDQRSVEEKVRGHSSGILFADQGGDMRGRKILMLANRPPAEAVNGRWGEVHSKAVPQAFLEHTDYRFEVVVNPTRRDSVSGKRLPIRTRQDIAEWFSGRSDSRWGFAIAPQSLQVLQTEVHQFHDKKGHPVTLSQARLNGQLHVTHPEKFRNSFAQGIGRGRAFGCGLLQIVPLAHQLFE